MLQIQERWPNGLGIDILDERGVELGEVWQLSQGKLGVRTFKANGDVDKYLLIDPLEHLFMNPFDAVALCREKGTVIE